jgi:hypothetical protein
MFQKEDRIFYQGSTIEYQTLRKSYLKTAKKNLQIYNSAVETICRLQFQNPTEG